METERACKTRSCDDGSKTAHVTQHIILCFRGQTRGVRASSNGDTQRYELKLEQMSDLARESRRAGQKIPTQTQTFRQVIK